MLRKTFIVTLLAISSFSQSNGQENTYKGVELKSDQDPWEVFYALKYAYAVALMQKNFSDLLGARSAWEETRGNAADKRIFHGDVFIFGNYGLSMVPARSEESVPQNIEFPDISLPYLIYVKAHYNRQILGVVQNPENSEGFARLTYGRFHNQWEQHYDLFKHDWRSIYSRTIEKAANAFAPLMEETRKKSIEQYKNTSELLKNINNLFNAGLKLYLADYVYEKILPELVKHEEYLELLGYGGYGIVSNIVWEASNPGIWKIVFDDVGVDATARAGNEGRYTLAASIKASIKGTLTLDFNGSIIEQDLQFSVRDFTGSLPKLATVLRDSVLEQLLKPTMTLRGKQMADLLKASQ